MNHAPDDRSRQVIAYHWSSQVISVALENAGGGSSQAAPVARKVMDFYFKDRTDLVKNPEDELTASVNNGQD